MSPNLSNTVSAVEFEHVSFSYGLQTTDSEDKPTTTSNASVCDVTFAVRPGECVVLTGLSGCGKTTITRLINGLIPSIYVGESQGSVWVQGRSLAEWEMDDFSCTVGSVFQNPRSQFFNLDTTSELAFGCENMGMPRDEIAQRVANTLATLQINHLIERDIRALSGGEKQLVALASVHALSPSIFVLDEPTAALDISAMQRLRKTILALKEAGNTILVAEHRLWWLADVVDRIIVVDKGRIVHDMSAAAFAMFSPEEKETYGLRAWNIQDVEPLANSSTSPSATPALVVRGLEVGYRGHPSIIKDCDLEA